MIAYLEGRVRFLEEDGVVLLVGGVGYKVYLTGVHPEVGDTIEVHIYDHIREDRRELYGFASRDVMQMFLKMIDISGIGTKLAQKILNSSTPTTIMQKIAAGDVDFLVSIPGVGKKTAQKIVLELKGVLVEAGTDEVVDSDTLDALMSLGYSKRDCLEIIGDLKSETTEDRIKEALKLLSRS